MRDSNPRLPPCKGGTLTAELNARLATSYQMVPHSPVEVHGSFVRSGQNCWVQDRVCVRRRVWWWLVAVPLLVDNPATGFQFSPCEAFRPDVAFSV